MTYDDALKATVDAATARREVERHGHDWNEFVADLGDRVEYEGADVLDWLGY